MRQRILGQPIDILSMEEAVYRVKAALIHPKQLKILTLNPEMVVLAKKNFEFQAAINTANLIVPDGIGIVWLLKSKGFNEIKRIAGIDLAENILIAAEEYNKKVAIFGSKKEVLEKCNLKLKEKFPHINFVKAIDGYIGKENEEKAAKEISSESPDIVLVALGTPTQDIWINKFSSFFPKSIMIGIGGTLDVWSGKKKRAPYWLIDMNLEWLYRIISEPTRIPRVFKSYLHLLFMVLQHKR